MRENFEEAIATLFELEGYDSNVRGDPGGRTILGIAERYWPDDVAAMIPMDYPNRVEYAKEFYIKHFWIPFKCHEREYPDDVITFTIAVNNGRIPYDSPEWIGDLLGSLINYIEIWEKHPERGQKFLKGWKNRVKKMFLKYDARGST